MNNDTASTNELEEDFQLYQQPYNYSPAEAVKKLKSNKSEGLPSTEVQSRQREFEPNEIPKVKTSLWKVYIAPISNWLINIYFAAAFSIFLLTFSIPSGYVSPLTDGVITQNELFLIVVPWFIVIGANSIVAIIQQYRGQKKLEALQELIANEATVIREGKQQNILVKELIPGDILILSQGDKVPADCLLLESHELTVNEAALTGESASIKKKVSPRGLGDGTPVHERSNMVFMGTFVMKGSAKCIVMKTGTQTIMGKLGSDLKNVTTSEIPIRKKVNILAKYLGIIVLILLSIAIISRLFILFSLASPIKWPDLAYITIRGIILALSVMPINIVLLVTIVLLTGVLAMAKKNVLVRDLSAVETLGRVSVICTDKTGTLTKNKMTVKRVWDCNTLYDVTGTGYKTEGVIVPIKNDKDDNNRSLHSSPMNHSKSVNTPSKPLELILLNCFLNNDAKIREGKLIGDPTDGACKVLFYKSLFNEDDVQRSHEIVAEFPFDSSLKRMAKIYRKENVNHVFVKGATEIILDRCTQIYNKEEPTRITEEKRKEIIEQVNDFAEQGYRVLSFAFKRVEDKPGEHDRRSQAESDLVYCGFVCISDPPRPDVYQAVKDCHSAGIDVIMVTGDATGTAKSIGKQLEIVDKNESNHIVEGKDIKELSEREFNKTKVFSRVSPENKQEIVKRYQEQERVTAMTGDGVNDALAVSMSDCGVAMGKEGTDLTKQASDIIITDDSFASIRTGVQEGRNLFRKIRRMCYFYICINAMEASVLFGLFFLFGFSDPSFTPFLNYQLQWITVTSHTFPAFALIFDKNTPKVMQEKPRNSEGIINFPLLKLILVHATLIAVSVLSMYILTLKGIYPLYPGNKTGVLTTELGLQKARTIAVCTIILAEVLLIFPIRRLNMSIFKSNTGEEFSPLMFILIGLILTGTIGLIYTPSVQRIALKVTNGAMRFNFIWLTWMDWIIILLAVLPSLVGVELYKWHVRKKGKRF